MWTCPECGRPFGKRRAHVCAPGLTADAYFDGKPPELRRIYAAVAKHVRKLEGAFIEPVSVGILFKRERTFAELRPRRKGFALSFVLRRPLRDERVTRTITMGEQLCHFVVLLEAKDVDDQVRGWLTEAFAMQAAPTHRAAARRARGST